MKRDFSEVTLQQAMRHIGQENILRWQINASSQQPSELLRQRWQSLHRVRAGFFGSGGVMVH